jgi:hypothetical protein
MTYLQLLEFLSCSPDHVVTDADLDELKKLVNQVWKRLNINVAFTNHFADRVNDARNKKQITVCELAKLFMEAYKKFGAELQHITKKEWEAVLSDAQTNVNIPFVLKHTGRTVELVSKTVMRKPGFFTPDPKLTVDDFQEWR